MRKDEFCIMKPDVRWSTKRFEGSHRHEVFGASNGHKSIEDGLVIILRPEDHNMSEKGIHTNVYCATLLPLVSFTILDVMI